MKKDVNDEAIYLYCLTRSDHGPTLAGTSVDGRNAIFFYILLDIAAVLAMVSLDAFCGPSAQSNLQDLSWVGPRVYRHEEVIEQVMRYSPVLPARFGTLFSSLDSLEKLLQTHHKEIIGFLDEVVGKDEWSVKVFLDKAKAREKLFSTVLSKKSARLATLSAGKRYFQEQRIRSSIDGEFRHWLRGVCGRIAEDLSFYASNCCERRLLSHGATGSNMDMVLNWAFLIPRGAAGDFLTRVQRMNVEHDSQGLLLEPTGPWPPYSFSPALKVELGS